MRILLRLLAAFLFIPTVFWNLTWQIGVRRRRWWDEVDDHLVLGAFPLGRHVPALAALGVGAVVNTCDEYAGPRAAYEAHGIEQLRIPTVDFNAPLLEDVQRAVTFMSDHAAAGRRIYVHCKAGRARSATVALCWLVAQRGMTPEQAQALLVQCRPQVMRRVFRRQVVADFVRSLERSQGSTGGD